MILAQACSDGRRCLLIGFEILRRSVISDGKATAESLSKVYDAQGVEAKWYRFWEEGGFFEAKVDARKKPFTIVIPPPNVTGSLHIGHALNNTLQDVIIRKKRMNGEVALWLPGTDHAGIATQNVVEQELEKEGLAREDLGREKFLERVWTWKETYGSTIIEQLKRLGCSCDWSRERFTMDDGYSRAVRQVFVRLYEEDLIYKDKYLINWCPRCRTALSDLEVEHEDVDGKLWYIRYPFIGSDRHLVVATTRPETMLGDTAVAVNPSDERYRADVGATIELPLVGRELPLIADEYVDPAFGTGVVKITPAHDPNDFEMARRHDLDQVSIFTQDAKMSDEVPAKYRGLDRYQCREAVLRDLESEGLLEKVESHQHAIGHCYRCRTVVEPYLSLQWFVKMRPLAGPAMEVVRDEVVSFVPENWTRTYFQWLENVRDWCISRQIWWGHQIPAWYCEDCTRTIVAVEEPADCPDCGGEVKQDADVLDTWFSSALWPFATLGWPDKTEDLAYFYPTNLLVTAHDIIYFWVARMIISGLHFMDEVPFGKVYIHTLIRDAHGKKMSKSSGNVIDPLDMIAVYGTDALRFTLTALATPGRDMYLSEEKIQGSRNFANKIWNASRFVLMNLDAHRDVASPKAVVEDIEPVLADRWMFSRYNRILTQVDEALEAYNFSQAVKDVHDFLWGEFCDWYLELAKPRLYGSDDGSRLAAHALLVIVLEGTLRCLHPFMPFITEEIWQKLPAPSDLSIVSNDKWQLHNSGGRKAESIMVAAWPRADSAFYDQAAEEQMDLIMRATTAIRSLRSLHRIPPAKTVTASLSLASPAQREVIEADRAYLMSLANLASLETGVDMTRPPQSAVAVDEDFEAFVPLTGLVDLENERQRLQKELVRMDAEKEKLTRKLANKSYVGKAPAEVVEGSRQRLAALGEQEKRLKLQLEALA